MKSTKTDEDETQKRSPDDEGENRKKASRKDEASMKSSKKDEDETGTKSPNDEGENRKKSSKKDEAAMKSAEKDEDETRTKSPNDEGENRKKSSRKDEALMKSTKTDEEETQTKSPNDEGENRKKSSKKDEAAMKSSKKDEDKNRIKSPGKEEDEIRTKSVNDEDERRKKSPKKHEDETRKQSSGKDEDENRIQSPKKDEDATRTKSRHDEGETRKQSSKKGEDENRIQPKEKDEDQNRMKLPKKDANETRKKSPKDEDKNQKKSPRKDEDRKETRVDIPPPAPPDGTWQTIDTETLYDREKCDLSRYDLDTVHRILESSPKGLTDDQVRERTEKFGENAIEHKERHPVIQFLLFMWNPLSWVMEAAAIVAIALSNGDGEPPDWPDFVGILLLLLINATIGYIEKYRAGNAVKALMASLAPECRVKRNSSPWKTIEASQLVPGDIVAIKLGNIIPADARIISSPGGVISIDQAALTGESLPVTKEIGDILLSSTTCKQGECEAVVIATGLNTQFGRAARMVGGSNDEMGHLQKILAKIGNFCIVCISIFIIAEIFAMYVGFGYSYRRGINNILVLLIGGLPIAMPTVLSVTLAIGAKQLSDRKAIVTRFTAIEELAGVTILCSDKTGTLTLNKLVIDKDTIVQYTDVGKDDIIRYAAYACNRENPDAIDTCVLESHGDAESIGDSISVKSFIPFDPTTKRTEVIYQDKSNSSNHRVSKGMPEAILRLCKTTEHADKVRKDVNEFAKRGLRGLAVAISDGDENFKLIGLLPILDPPREDTQETIRKALELGVRVKMITGDQLEIAKETGRRLKMGDTMYVYEDLIHGKGKSAKSEEEIDDIVLQADGFASVYPEHKFEIVKRLQDMGHLVAMTGDGVNDAPALSRANVGIAVSDASDAARSAAAIVLTEPGLSVIIDAVLGSRQIFARMSSYAIYTCSVTIRVIVAFALLIFIFRYDFPPFMILIMAILNDGTIMTISKDRVEPSPEPNEWRLKQVFISAITYGLYLSASTVVFFAIAVQTSFFQDRFGVDTIPQTTDGGYAHHHLHAMIYLQVSSISQGLIFVTRSRGFCFTERPTLLLIAAFILTQLCATFIAVYANWGFTDIRGCGWTWAVIIWIYNVIWFIPLDYIKFVLQAVFNRSLHAVKPFEHIHRRIIARRHAKVSGPQKVPFGKRLSGRPSQPKQVPSQEPLEPKTSTCMPKKLDQITQTGSSFYSSYTDTLSILRIQNPILRPVSIS